MTSNILKYTSFRPRIPEELNRVVLSNKRAEEVPTGVNRYMKMPSYLESRAEAYGHLEELEIDPRAARACTPGWCITVIDSMMQKGITMKIKPEVSLRQQLAIQADRFLEILDESCHPVTGAVVVAVAVAVTVVVVVAVLVEGVVMVVVAVVVAVAVAIVGMMAAVATATVAALWWLEVVGVAGARVRMRAVARANARVVAKAVVRAVARAEARVVARAVVRAVAVAVAVAVAMR
jgi:hypothetical protein